jgi:hypothetical protein
VDQSTNWAKTIVWYILSSISMDRLVIWPYCSCSISECFVITGPHSPQSLLRGEWPEFLFEEIGNCPGIDYCPTERLAISLDQPIMVGILLIPMTV